MSKMFQFLFNLVGINRLKYKLGGAKRTNNDLTKNCEKETVKHRIEVQALEETFGVGWDLIKYPKDQNEAAIYYCNAGHVFEMDPEVFLRNKRCPVCEIGKEVKRGSPEYRAFLREAKKVNKGKCELTDDEDVDVHHLYSIRMYPELSYNPKNAILLSRYLHKEYHRFFSPYNTNPYTFLAWLYWLQDESNIENITETAINNLISKVRLIMQDLESDVMRNRSKIKNVHTPSNINKIICDRQKLQAVLDKLKRLTDLIIYTKGENVELKSNKIFILDYTTVIYRNDYGNWLEFNPVSGGISESAYNAIIKA